MNTCAGKSWSGRLQGLQLFHLLWLLCFHNSSRASFPVFRLEDSNPVVHLLHACSNKLQFRYLPRAKACLLGNLYHLLIVLLLKFCVGCHKCWLTKRVNNFQANTVFQCLCAFPDLCQFGSTPKYVLSGKRHVFPDKLLNAKQLSVRKRFNPDKLLITKHLSMKRQLFTDVSWC